MKANGCTQWTYKHAYFAHMRGLRTRDGRIIRSGEELRHLYEMHASQPPANPHRTTNVMATFDYQSLSEDIDDKSKADWLAKLLAVLQMGRFLFGAISRLAAHFPISPLESVTCAYVLCTLLTYVFWFHKPYNVQEPIRIEVGATYVLDHANIPSPPDGDSILEKREFSGTFIAWS